MGRNRIYIAVLEEDYEPHYFYNIEKAFEYLEMCADIITGEYVWTHTDNFWTLNDIGYISIDEFED